MSYFLDLSRVEYIQIHDLVVLFIKILLNYKVLVSSLPIYRATKCILKLTNIWSSFRRAFNVYHFKRSSQTTSFIVANTSDDVRKEWAMGWIKTNDICYNKSIQLAIIITAVKYAPIFNIRHSSHKDSRYSWRTSQRLE